MRPAAPVPTGYMLVGTKLVTVGALAFPPMRPLPTLPPGNGLAPGIWAN